MSVVKVRDIKIEKDFNFMAREIIDLKNDKLMFLGQNARNGKIGIAVY
jgi:hypothetical protein